MESFLKSIAEKRRDEESHKYFIRFGKGRFNRRFLISLDKGSKIKIRASFELANDLVKFVNENKYLKFSGKVLTKSKEAGKKGRKKAGVFVYEIENSDINEFENAYYYLLDVSDSELVLKIKKSLPKPGKNENKIDDHFCSLDSDLKFWPKLKDAFFWDIPECKKAVIEHDLIINEIEIPKGEKDPMKIRENAKRKGKLIRRINADGREIVKEYELEI